MVKLNGKTMPEVFQNQAKKLGDKACVAYKKDGKYTDISWNEMNAMVHKLGWYLMSIGVKKGDRVGLFSSNRYEWWVGDLAITSIGAINVPIYATNSAEEARYILDHSESVACLCGEKGHMEKVLEVKKKLPKLKSLVVFDELDIKNKKDVLTFKQALEKGDKYTKKGEFEKRIKSLDDKKMATIIYTSGTTGNPKGVMLSHYNFVSDVRIIYQKFYEYFGDGKSMVSFLPLSHSLERTSGYYLPVAVGARVAFAEDFGKVVDNMKEIQPDFIISVPRLYEKIHATVLAGVAAASPVKRLLFNLAMKTAKKNLVYVCQDKPKPALFQKRYDLFNKLVFSKFRTALGMSKMDFAVSGGAPLSIADAEFFIGMGIKVLEGFGLTETTPVTNVNPPWFIKPGTVGPALPETTIKIADDGELLIKGPQVMMGYYKNKKATDEVFTKDGFFRTGDIAVIDSDGYMSITGRIKDIIVTAGGKNISPQNIESDLLTSMYIEQVAIIGDKRKYLTALVIPAFGALQAWAKRNNIPFTSNTDLINNEQVIALFDQEIKNHMKNYARVEQIRKFKLLEAEWTQQTGELTPSLKVKRRIINEKYSKEIEEMYPPDLN
ncbi:MAG TPA: long-chain fatty acid--CoA ligase [Spirochaetota bacterium]|nr:long-chain fatty acid--CoA ligase [Spirochaetota bacterium]HRZ27600.1 long-chain fatty acid--CoA ligase [Spirochaetota bacterium]HSA13848.1 long-chain fatty acid--CoA ligase [Spirochaetota bacterium]